MVVPQALVFKLGFVDGWAGFVIAFGNFEGTFYRYAKRYEQAQDWRPPESEPIRREQANSVCSRLREVHCPRKREIQ